MTVVHHTPQDMAAWRASWDRDPAIAKLYEFIVDYATQRGGLVLAVWKLHMGQIFGEPVMMTPDEVAKRLKLPLSDVTKIIADTDAFVRPRWKGTREYQSSQFAAE